MPMRSRWWPLWITLLVLALLAIKALNKRDDLSGPIAFGVLIIVVSAGFLVARRRFRRRLRRWAAHAEWTPVDPDEQQWPWLPHRQGGSAVRRAWRRDVDGLPVTFGELRWKGNAFAGLVVQRKGSGAVVVIRLPQSQPPMALHHRFKPVGDSFRLRQPALLDAYLAGDIGTWTVNGDELFTVEARDVWIDPEIADHAVRRALRVVRLLDLGPDTTTSVAPGPGE